MGYLISTNKSMLEALQLKIHNYMKANIENYSADRWAIVEKHPTEELFSIWIKEEDNRLPYMAITNSEKSQMIDKLPDGWVVPDIDTP